MIPIISSVLIAATPHNFDTSELTEINHSQSSLHVAEEDITIDNSKSVKVFDDLSRNSFRYFYPDFLLFGCKIIEVDGVYHDDKEQKLVDLTRTRILERNGYRLGARISHEEVIKNKEYMFNIIEYLKELKKCSEHKSVTANDLIHGDIKNAINCRN